MNSNNQMGHLQRKLLQGGGGGGGWGWIMRVAGFTNHSGREQLSLAHTHTHKNAGKAARLHTRRSPSPKLARQTERGWRGGGACTHARRRQSVSPIDVNLLLSVIICTQAGFILNQRDGVK